MVFISQDGKFIKRWDIIAIYEMVTIALSFDGFTFPNVKDDIPICSPDLTFKCLSVSL